MMLLMSPDVDTLSPADMMLLIADARCRYYRHTMLPPFCHLPLMLFHDATLMLSDTLCCRLLLAHALLLRNVARAVACRRRVAHTIMRVRAFAIALCAT